MRIDPTSGDIDFTYLSLGAGVQSSALLVLACTDDRVPKPDVAIFADTGDEPAWVYEYLEVLKTYAESHGIEVIVAQKGRLSEWVVDRQRSGERFISVPLFTKNSDGSTGMLMRQCTQEFKIQPIIKAVRKHMGYKPRQRVKERVRCMMGISLDEVERLKPSPLNWCTNSFPLVDLGITREDCYKIIEDVGLPKPERSACVYCPYHSDSYWKWLQDNHPDEFGKAVEFDNDIRDMTARGRNSPGYVHRSLTPLSEVIFGGDPDQVDMFGSECEGMCGV